MSDLKPCPFCGPALVEQSLDAEIGLHIALCRSCGTRLWVESWQRRPIEDALRAEILKYRGMEVEDAALRVDKEELRAEIAALKAMYEPPLTEGDVSAIARHNGVSRFDVYTIDAACMKVRRERGSDGIRPVQQRQRP